MGKKIIYEKRPDCITFCCRETPAEFSEVEIADGKANERYNNFWHENRNTF